MKQNVPESALDTMISSLSPNTLSQYSSSLKLWWQYCEQNKNDFYDVTVPNLMGFLMKCFNSGSAYGTLNNHRSAIALVSMNDFSQDSRLKRFYKGIFKLKPVFPRYSTTWDTNIVLDYLNNVNNDSASLELLTKKLTMLLALSSGQRTQTLSLIKVCDIKSFNDKIIITITSIIKTSGIGRAQPVIALPFFTINQNICPAKTLQSYLNRTVNLRNDSNGRLLLTIKKPHRAATSQSIGRWLKQTLCDSGIDTTIFTAHSTRHASTSAAARSGISVELIRKSAGWSDRSTVFGNFYNRPIIRDNVSLINDND